MDNDIQDILICKCFNHDHQIGVQVLEEGDTKDVIFIPYLTTHLNVFKRIWVAIKYVFKSKDFYRAFDSVILKDEDRQKLATYLKNKENEQE